MVEQENEVIFISHKTHDDQFAKHVKTVLESFRFPERKLEVFVASHADNVGIDWRANIKAHLRRARCFILLYTDPQEDWSWCHWEAGFFEAARMDRTARPDEQPQLAALYKYAPPGKGLTRFQGISIGEGDALGEFLSRVVFRKKNNQNEQIQALAKNLRKLFEVTPRPARPALPELSFTLVRSGRDLEAEKACPEHPDLEMDRFLRRSRLPKEITVAGSGLRVFGFKDGIQATCSWKEFHSHLLLLTAAGQFLEPVLANIMHTEMTGKHLEIPRYTCVFQARLNSPSLYRLVLLSTSLRASVGPNFRFGVLRIPRQAFQPEEWWSPEDLMTRRKLSLKFLRQLKTFWEEWQGRCADLQMEALCNNLRILLDQFCRQALETMAKFYGAPPHPIAKKFGFWSTRWRTAFEALTCLARYEPKNTWLEAPRLSKTEPADEITIHEVAKRVALGLEPLKQGLLDYVHDLDAALQGPVRSKYF